MQAIQNKRYNGSQMEKSVSGKAPNVFESKSRKTMTKIEKLERVIGCLTVEKEILKKATDLLM